MFLFLPQSVRSAAENTFTWQTRPCAWHRSNAVLTSGDSPGKSRQPHTFHYFLLLHCRIDTVYSGPKSALGVRGTQSIRFTHANLLFCACYGSREDDMGFQWYFRPVANVLCWEDSFANVSGHNYSISLLKLDEFCNYLNDIKVLITFD